MNDTAPSRSEHLFARAQQVVAAGVSSSFRAAVKPEPLFVASGSGGRLTDVNGTDYLDFTLAWGPLILGHCHPAVTAAVAAQLERGHMFGAQHVLEAEVAEQLVAILPCADLVTFASSGTEAVQVALRLARARTGRQRIVKFEGHYHGWSDGTLISYHPPLDAVGPYAAPAAVPGTSGQSMAALGDVIAVPWNDAAALAAVLARHGPSIAAILMEPVLYNSGVIAPAPGYLESARALASEHGALLIFDEVITGFRLALGGAQECYGITPDIAVYAKAVAAGFPLSVIAGRREVMGLISSGVVAHSGTYNGNPICLAAAAAAIAVLSRPGTFEHLHQLGMALASGAREILARYKIAAVVNQLGPVMQILFTEQPSVTNYRAFAACDARMNAALTVRLRKNGVLILPDGRWYMATVHTHEDVLYALKALDASLGDMQTGSTG
jgi:glutamate-1-semialdehyde 2,1-aminomutase